MRIAIAGTHGSGKSTLAEEFIAAHGEYAHEPEPYEWLVHVLAEEVSAEPDADDFYRQLEISVERLSAYPPGSRVVFERSPADFVAYLLALRELRRGNAEDILESATSLAARGMRHLDILVVLPLNDRDGIIAPESEDLDLRQAMNDHLLEILTTDEYDLLGDTTSVIEASGTRGARLHAMEACIEDHRHLSKMCLE